MDDEVALKGDDEAGDNILEFLKDRDRRVRCFFFISLAHNSFVHNSLFFQSLILRVINLIVHFPFILYYIFQIKKRLLPLTKKCMKSKGNFNARLNRGNWGHREHANSCT